VTVTVKASKASAQPMSVRLATVNDTAKSGSDFTAVSNREIVIAAGETSRTTTVPVVGDLIGENLETFKVALTSPTGGAVVDDGTGVVTITDNDTI
jgi:endoglucanase